MTQQEGSLAIVNGDGVQTGIESRPQVSLSKVVESLDHRKWVYDSGAFRRVGDMRINEPGRQADRES